MTRSAGLLWATLFVVGACARETGSEQPKLAPPGPEVAVELAGVTLAEDCAPGRTTKPLVPPSGDSAGTRPGPAAAKPSEATASAVCARGANCGLPQPACEQTQMQLAIQAHGQRSSLKIKRIELLDKDGKVVGELTAREPSRWQDSRYVAWDEAIAGQDLVASYKLTAPDWDKLTKGRWNAASHRFQLRVTVTIGNRERTIERQSITPAMPEPEVAT